MSITHLPVAAFGGADADQPAISTEFATPWRQGGREAEDEHFFHWEASALEPSFTLVTHGKNGYLTAVKPVEDDITTIAEVNRPSAVFRVGV